MDYMGNILQSHSNRNLFSYNSQNPVQEGFVTGDTTLQGFYGAISCYVPSSLVLTLEEEVTGDKIALW